MECFARLLLSCMSPCCIFFKETASLAVRLAEAVLVEEDEDNTPPTGIRLPRCYEARRLGVPHADDIGERICMTCVPFDSSKCTCHRCFQYFA